jgi:hypothetical protein
MEDRSITLDFVEGKIKGVWLKATLDQTYKRLFENAYKSSKKYPTNAAHGIKIIVFGCFWLESYANELLRMILRLEISSSKLQKEIWARLKRISIEEKIGFFSKLLPSELQKEYQSLKIPVKKIYDLRGRLAHYKDEPKKITDEISPDDFFINVLNNIPIPELNRQLMWDEVKAHAETIKSTSKWFSKIINHYHKIKGIKSTNKKLKPQLFT